MEKAESGLEVILGLLLAISVDTPTQLQDTGFQSRLLSDLFEGKVKGEALKFEIKIGKDGIPRISVNVDRPLLVQYLQTIVNEIRARSEVRKAA